MTLAPPRRRPTQVRRRPVPLRRKRRRWVGFLVVVALLLGAAIGLVGQAINTLAGGLLAGDAGGTTAATATQTDPCVTDVSLASLTSPGSNGWVIPLGRAYQVTSEYGYRIHPIQGYRKLHSGIDLATPTPGTNILAAAAGTVTSAGFAGSYGNMVEISHGNGTATRYAHMASLSVRQGQTVTAGTPIGVEGNTGEVNGRPTSAGRHLHFEVLQHGNKINPRIFLEARGVPLDGQAAPPKRVEELAAGLENTPPAAIAAESPAGAATGGTFALPLPGEPRQNSLSAPPLPIPADIQALYESAANKYGIPWTLLAGIGMEETGHGRNKNTSVAGARGPMQFMPATWVNFGVDGDGDGDADILNPADAIPAAAGYLVEHGATQGEAGVRKALFAYNHANWYVNDVLHYAQQYGGGTVSAVACPPVAGVASAPVSDATTATYLKWAASKAGGAYVMGANGPNAWDCSSLVQGAMRLIGLDIPRTAAAQERWFAAGGGTPIKPGQEQAGDIMFWDSYLGPNTVGHVAIVWDPVAKKTIEAQGVATGVGHFSYAGKDKKKNIFKIYRPGRATGSAT